MTSWWECRLTGAYGVEAGMDSIELPDKQVSCGHGHSGSLYITKTFSPSITDFLKIGVKGLEDKILILLRQF